MYILTELGIDTGFPKGLDHSPYGILGNDCGGRYEMNLRGSTIIKRPFPYVLKEPQMCSDIDLRIERLALDVDHIYIMLRRPGPIANALEFMRRGAREPKNFERSMSGADLDMLTEAFMTRISQLTHLVAEMDIPHTLVSYPKYASDHEYAYSKFSFLMGKYNISFNQYKEVAERCVDKKQIQHAYDVMPEWCRARMRETYAFKRRPVGPSVNPDSKEVRKFVNK
jgi:hypothetical protein